MNSKISLQMYLNSSFEMSVWDKVIWFTHSGTGICIESLKFFKGIEECILNNQGSKQLCDYYFIKIVIYYYNT